MYIPKTTDLRSYPSHRFAAGPSRSRVTGDYGFGDIHLISALSF